MDTPPAGEPEKQARPPLPGLAPPPAPPAPSPKPEASRAPVPAAPPPRSNGQAGVINVPAPVVAPKTTAAPPAPPPPRPPVEAPRAKPERASVERAVVERAVVERAPVERAPVERAPVAERVPPGPPPVAPPPAQSRVPVAVKEPAAGLLDLAIALALGDEPVTAAAVAMSTAADEAALRATFEDLAVAHVADVRSVMMEVRWGEAQASWLEIARPA